MGRSFAPAQNNYSGMICTSEVQAHEVQIGGAGP